MRGSIQGPNADVRRGDEAGFTIVELVIALAVLAMVIAPLAQVFVSGLRTAGSANHRTDGSSIASREIEGMHAVPYGQVGFYANQPGYTAGFEGFTTVSLGSTAPTSGPSVPQIAPSTTGITQGGVSYSVARYIVWVGAQDPSTTYAGAYKRLTVIVSWSDQAGAHTAREDSLLYPGGLGTYQGPMGGTASSTTTTALLNPSAPVLNAITGLPDPAGETQVPLSWSQPAFGAPITSYSVEYSTSASFPPGNFSIVSLASPSITSYTVTNLSAGTTYYFEIIAYAGTNSALSNVQSIATLPQAAPTCNLGQLNVTGATSLSTTGTRLQTNGKMSENLTLAWTNTGTCPHSYVVQGTDPSGNVDPGSPYALVGGSGTFGQTIASTDSKSWGLGLHTFTVWDVTNNKTTSVVKTFRVCMKGAPTC